MGATSFIPRSLLVSLGLLSATFAVAAEQEQLVNAINTYRGEVQSCAGSASQILPPLAVEQRLAIPAGVGDWKAALNQTGYPMSSVRMLSLTGPRDANAAMKALQESFCQVLLDPQFVDVGVSHEGDDWRILLGRPLLQGKLGTWEAEGQQLLQAINAARGQARQCGGQNFGNAPALSWNAILGTIAEGHSRDMANNNYFDHKGRDGSTPGDRAELGGYSFQQIGENIAAGQGNARKVVDSWLSSPGHCANLMNPQFRELGAAYAADPKSDAGIYWTAMFGSP
nr:CAP domain-containing protein [uncultured Pseudomonas sp.]